MPAEVLRAVLTFRLSPEGEISPTVVVAYAVNGVGPFLIEGGEPPVRSSEVLGKIREEARKIEEVLRG
jgi:hypothetical protein